MPAAPLRIGVAQIDTRLATAEANLDKHLEYIERARAEGVELLVFPETSLTGFPHREGAGDGGVHQHALSRRSVPIQRVLEAAGDLVVVVGFLEEAPAAQFYNSALALGRGEQLHLHRKLNLATYGSLEESKYFAQGRYVDSFDLVPDTWRVSVLICADSWNPALVHLAALHGATLLVIPTNSAEDAVGAEFSNPDGWDLATRFYAMIYGMPLVMANRVGTESGQRFWGGSRIVDPLGNVLGEAPRDEEALLTAEISYEAVRRARIQLPTVRDSNLALVHREIARLEQLIGVPSSVRGGGETS